MKILFLSHSKAEQVEQIPNFMKTYGDDVIINFDKISLDYVKRIKVEFIVCDRYENLIKKDIIEHMNGKIINAHPSILPLNKGWQSNFWSVYYDTAKGVTIHYVDEGLDSGDIIAQENITVNNTETLRNLYYKSRAAMIKLFFDNWVKIRNDKSSRIKQIHEKGTTYYKKQFDPIFPLLPKGWDTSVEEIHNLKLKKII